MAMDKVLRRNLFISATFGAEYIMPIIIIEMIIIILVRSNITKDNSIATPLVDIIKNHACFFETMPEAKGLFFRLALSSSTSTKSLRMYMPVDMSKEIRGKDTIEQASSKKSSCLPTDNRKPGIHNKPAIVADEYNIPHFLRDLNKIN